MAPPENKSLCFGKTDHQVGLESKNTVITQIGLKLIWVNKYHNFMKIVEKFKIKEGWKKLVG
jgi:hypothetical protein